MLDGHTSQIDIHVSHFRDFLDMINAVYKWDNLLIEIN